jgi:pimeloyl-ACP methyl ester carboxylesterase
MESRPFRIQVADSVLADLQARLARARLSVVKTNAGWEAGTDPDYLRDLVDYWRSGYNWRREEARLNELPQFKAAVDGTDLHFVHVRGRGPRPVPLLLLHGWPDSFFRYHKVVRPFSDPVAAGGQDVDAFDVVVPSLPGFAFTGPVHQRADAGVGEKADGGRERSKANRYSAQLIWRLMTEGLGYPRFAVAGGDGGSVIAQILAIDHPEAVMGIHLTDIGWHALAVDAASASKAEQKFLAGSQKHAMSNGAYALVQMSQPRSLAAGLNDSPVGLASWILDRFHCWSDADGDLDKSFGKDDLLTNIMIYWVTQTIGASVFSYHTEARSPSLTTAEHVDQPVAMALFPKEPGGIPPRSLAERTLNVQRWTEMSFGGHFAALEEPKLFVHDVVEFFRPLRELPARPEQGGQHVASSL